jgi:hypothetical protein
MTTQTFVRIGSSDYQLENGIGDLYMNADQSPVSPYVSIGMSFYLDKQKHWSLDGELGVAYTGDPDVTLSTSSGAEAANTPLGGQLRSDLNSEARQIEDGAWKVYPIIKVSVSYSF